MLLCGIELYESLCKRSLLKKRMECVLVQPYGFIFGQCHYGWHLVRDYSWLQN